jgi:ubiquinone/menaquinone biosynthesis C-methylase UbiE
MCGSRQNERAGRKGAGARREKPFAGFTLTAARGYEAWYRSPAGRRMVLNEQALLARLLGHLPDTRSVVDIGCGTGHFTRWFAARGLGTIGVDPVPAMLAVARELGQAERYVLAAAEALPFRTGSVDLAAMITSLEFMAKPGLALREAGRVARSGLLLGVLNLASPLGAGRKLVALLQPSPYRAARFMTAWALERLVRRAVGRRVAWVRWATTLWPVWVPAPARRLPFGGFIGMAVRFDQQAGAE